MVLEFQPPDFTSTGCLLVLEFNPRILRSITGCLMVLELRAPNFKLKHGWFYSFGTSGPQLYAQARVV